MNPFKRSKPWPSGHGCVTTKGATMGKGLREQGTSETEPVSGGELHREDSGAFYRPCAGCDTVNQSCRDAGCQAEVGIDFDVLNAKIRADAEREARFLGNCPACVSPMYGPCGRCISEHMATERADVRHEIAERDATIERLTKERDDARAVIDMRDDRTEHLQRLRNVRTDGNLPHILACVCRTCTATS